MQANNPADSRVVLKFGGAAPEYSSDIYSYHLDYERKIAKRPGYQLYGLSRANAHGHEAVEWEFEWRAPEGRRYVRSVYWRTAGIEYFVYAHAPADRWSEFAPVLGAMLENATP